MIEIYHWEPNSHQAKPMMALYEKGVPFVSHYVDILEFEHVSPEFLKICPTGQVPCMAVNGRLIHDAIYLSESTDMCEYIDEAYPGPALRPASAEERWRMRWWCKFMDDYFAPALSMPAWKTFMGPIARRKDPERIKRFLSAIPLESTRMHWTMAINDQFTDDVIAECRRRVESAVGTLERGLSRTAYLAGDEFSLADLCVFATIYGFPLTNPDLADARKTPQLWDWLRRCHARPSMEKTFALGRGRVAERVKEMRALLTRS